MTEPAIFTPEQAQALSEHFDLMVHSTVSLDWAEDIAIQVHQERVRRVSEWASEQNMGLPDPCCPFFCGACDQEHNCFDDSDECVAPAPGGLEWTDDMGVLAMVTYEVLWANDPKKTEALITKQVEETKSVLLAQFEQKELAERAHMAELQHKYQEQA